MRSPNGFIAGCAALTLLGFSAFAAADTSRPPVSYGTPISEADVASWDIDIQTKSGKGLPPGQGSVAEGEKIFATKCAACHGAGAAGGPQYGAMFGGIGSMTEKKRKLTPGSMYPYAPILFDYTRRAMPMDAPQSLSNNEVYALTAYIYHLNGLVEKDATVDAASLSAMKMPNRDGFIADDRPDTKAVRCMQDCN
ncbi:MAG: c-type cytochrome [Gammaproteobacteria bacterium]|nr:c-type cytochrome [Gammaproteobacteria bacterium]